MMPEPAHDFTQSGLPVPDELVADAVSRARDGGRETMAFLMQCAQEGSAMAFIGVVDLVPVAERVAFAATCAASGNSAALRFLLSRAQAGDRTAFAFLQGRLRAGHSFVLAFLVGCARGREEFAFEFLYRNFAPGLRAYLRGRIGDASVAEEIAQDAFSRVWTELPKANDETETKFKSWLYRIATNLSNDYFRSTKHSQVQMQSFEELTEDGLPTVPSTEGPEEYVAERELTKQALELVTPEQRDVILMEAYLNLSQREKAKRLGIAESTFSSSLSRGRKELERKRKHLLSELDMPEGRGPTI